MRALKAGANVVMPVLTPVEEKVKYQLYKGKTDVKSGLDVLRSQAMAAGREMILTTPGDPSEWSSQHRSE